MVSSTSVNHIEKTTIDSSNPRKVSTRQGDPTINLLLTCIQAQLGTCSPEQLKQLVEDDIDIDWTYLLDTADYHGMVPTLYSSLRTTCPEAMPKTILVSLKRHFKTIAQHNLSLTVELIHLLQWLNSHNIPAIPFKGPILATVAYGDLSLRQFVDLDIVIHKKDAARIKQLMLVDGYQQVSHIAPSKAYEAIYLRAACEYNFFREDRKVAVEPHWGFAPARLGITWNPETLWQRLETASIAGNQLPTFSPEDLLLIMCINGVKDHWCSFKPICDIAAITCNCQIDWNILLQRTQQIGCQRILFWGLNLAYLMLNSPIPDSVLQRIQADQVCQTLTTQVCDLLLTGSEYQPRQYGPTFSPWVLQARECKRDKIYYLFNLIFGPNEGDALIIDLPPFLYWLYPLLRPFRLLIRLGRGQVQ